MMTLEKLTELYKAREEARVEFQRCAPGLSQGSPNSPECIRFSIRHDIDRYLAQQAYIHADKAYEDAIAEMAQQQ